MPSYNKKRVYKRYNKKVNSFTPKVKRVLYSIAEKKHLEHGNTAQTIGSVGWGINQLLCSTTASGTDSVGSGIVQGAGFNQRVGERVRITALRITLYLYPTSGGVIPVNGMTCRFVIVQDKLPNLGYASVLDIMETNSIMSNYNLTKRDRFKILKDFVHQQVPTVANAGAVLGGGPQSLQKLNFYPKCETEYTGSTGVTNAIFKNGFYILALCNVAGCTTMEWRNQIEYQDM